MTKKERIAALEAQIAAMKMEMQLMKALLAGKQDKPPAGFQQPLTWPNMYPPQIIYGPQYPNKVMEWTCRGVGQ